MDFKTQFPRQHTVLPLIRIDDAEDTIMKCADEIRSEGAHGAILINRLVNNVPAIGYEKVTEVYRKIRARHPGWWVGINFADLNSLRAAKRIPPEAAGIWIPDAGINTTNLVSPTVWADNVRIILEKRGNGRRVVFGGLVSERTDENDILLAAVLAKRFVNVIVLGNEGRAPELQEILNVRRAIGDFPLAVAGIMHASTMEKMMPYVDCFLPFAHQSQHSHASSEIKGFLINTLLMEGRDHQKAAYTHVSPPFLYSYNFILRRFRFAVRVIQLSRFHTLQRRQGS